MALLDLINFFIQCSGCKGTLGFSLLWARTKLWCHFVHYWDTHSVYYCRCCEWWDVSAHAELWDHQKDDWRIWRGKILLPVEHAFSDVFNMLDIFVSVLNKSIVCHCRTVETTHSQWLGHSGRSSSPVFASSFLYWSDSVSTASSMMSIWWTQSSPCSPVCQTPKCEPLDIPAH